MTLLWVLVLSSLGQADAALKVPEGVIAIGDVHGDYPTFLRLLQSLELVDGAGSWRGGKRRLIQTGDLIDRAPGSRQVLDLMMRLETEARAAGGEVVQILGNHEVMNMVGDLTSTTVPEFEAYAGDESAELRAERKAGILRFLREGSPLLRSSYTRDYYRLLNESSFDRYFPPGFFAQRQALSPSGRYGQWLLEHPVIHREDRTLFLHGGLHVKYAELPLEEINREVKTAVTAYAAAVAELERRGAFDSALGERELRYLFRIEREAGGPLPELASVFARIEALWRSLIFEDEGPLWYRGLAQATGREPGLWRSLEATLRAQAAERMVIGHTQPASYEVESRFGHRVILIDTGMNQLVFRGRPSAIILTPEGKIKIW